MSLLLKQSIALLCAVTCIREGLDSVTVRSIFQPPVAARWLEDDEGATEHSHAAIKPVGVELY